MSVLKLLDLIIQAIDPNKGGFDAAAIQEARAACDDGCGCVDGHQVEATPAAEELADELGVELTDVEGSGKDGRVTKADVEAAAE